MEIYKWYKSSFRRSLFISKKEEKYFIDISNYGLYTGCIKKSNFSALLYLNYSAYERDFSHSERLAVE